MSKTSECGPLSRCARQGHVDALDHGPGAAEVEHAHHANLDFGHDDCDCGPLSASFLAAVVIFLEGLDEDVAAVKHCSPAPWQSTPRGTYVDDAEGKRLAQVAFTEDGLHIARHDPARVLRDVAAKRAIVAALKAALDALGRHQHKITDSKGTICAGCLYDWPCPDIKAIEDALRSVHPVPDSHGQERQAASDGTVEQHEVDPI